VIDPLPSNASHGSDIKGRLVECFREVFPDLGDDQILAAEYSEIAAWDSLASFTLVAVIEDEFDCSLPDELVADLTSFDRIRAAVTDLSHSAD
jgi:acyl carrier protein